MDTNGTTFVSRMIASVAFNFSADSLTADASVFSAFTIIQAHQPTEARSFS